MSRTARLRVVLVQHSASPFGVAVTVKPSCAGCGCYTPSYFLRSFACRFNTKYLVHDSGCEADRNPRVLGFDASLVRLSRVAVGFLISCVVNCVIGMQHPVCSLLPHLSPPRPYSSIGSVRAFICFLFDGKFTKLVPVYSSIDYRALNIFLYLLCVIDETNHSALVPLFVKESRR